MATPAQQGQQCQPNKGSNTSTMRAMMSAQRKRGWQFKHDWWCQRNKSWHQVDKGDNTDEVVDASVECGYNYLRLLLYANWQHIWTAYQCSQTLCKCQRWMKEAVWAGCQPQTWHHDIILTPQPQVTQNQYLSLLLWVKLCKADTVCQWTAYQCAEILCICLIWMWEAVWGGCQPQPWHHHIILTKQVTQSPKIWAK